MTSHYTWESVTTLHDFGGVLGRPFDTFFGLSQFHGHYSWLVCEVALRTWMNCQYPDECAHIGHFVWALTISRSRLLACVWSGPKNLDELPISGWMCTYMDEKHVLIHKSGFTTPIIVASSAIKLTWIFWMKREKKSQEMALGLGGMLLKVALHENIQVRKWEESDHKQEATDVTLYFYGRMKFWSSFGITFPCASK